MALYLTVTPHGAVMPFVSGATDHRTAIQAPLAAAKRPRRINNLRTLLHLVFDQPACNQQLMRSLSANTGGIPPKSETQAKTSGIWHCGNPAQPWDRPF